jgi:signal peptidase I
MHDGYPAGTVSGDLDDSSRVPPHGPEDGGGTSELPIQPAPAQRQVERPAERNAVWEVVETLILAVLIFVAVRSVVLNFRVDGLSMEPTLDTGEMLLVNRQIYFHFDAYNVVDWLPFVEHDEQKIVYPFHPPQRGDIVVLHPPIDGGKPYIKRVIGLPGETVSIHDGAVYINGERLDEPYLNGVATTWAGSIRAEELTIEDDEVFVMGDNRNNSTDSRVFGPIEIDEIIGKAWIAFWPLERLDILQTPEYAE